MSFMFKKRDSYFWTVEHPVEMTEGEQKSAAFDIAFKAETQSRVNEIMTEISAGRLTDAQLVAESVIGWRGVHGEDGKDEPFSKDALAQLCEAYPGLRGSICVAWLKSNTGGAARKN